MGGIALITDSRGRLATHPSGLGALDLDEDEIPLDHMLALRSGLPDAQLAVVPAAGHGLPLDRPELFTLLVTEFVTMRVGPLAP